MSSVHLLSFVGRPKPAKENAAKWSLVPQGLLECRYPVAVIRLRESVVIHLLPRGRSSFVGRTAWSTTESLTPPTQVHSTAQKWEHALGGNNLARKRGDVCCLNCQAKQCHSTLFRRPHSLYNAALRHTQPAATQAGAAGSAGVGWLAASRHLLTGPTHGSLLASAGHPDLSTGKREALHTEGRGREGREEQKPAAHSCVSNQVQRRRRQRACMGSAADATML